MSKATPPKAATQLGAASKCSFRAIQEVHFARDSFKGNKKGLLGEKTKKNGVRQRTQSLRRFCVQILWEKWKEGNRFSFLRVVAQRIKFF